MFPGTASDEQSAWRETAAARPFPSPPRERRSDVANMESPWLADIGLNPSDVRDASALPLTVIRPNPRAARP